jgi:hypothetical protein
MATKVSIAPFTRIDEQIAINLDVNGGVVKDIKQTTLQTFGVYPVSHGLALASIVLGGVIEKNQHVNCMRGDKWMEI